MTKHCKGCKYHHVGVGKRSDWCTWHSTVARKAKSICIIQGTKPPQEKP